MTKEDLIPIKKGETYLAKLGGSTKSPQKRLSALIVQSAKARCKNCKAVCYLKKSNLEQSNSMICPIPEARAKAIFYAKPVMDEGILDKIAHETLIRMQGLATDVKDLKLLHDSVVKQKASDYPQTQKLEVQQTTISTSLRDLKEIYEDIYGPK